jgi:hypothetical protein
METPADYFACATQHLVRGIQLESRAALDRAEAELATPGLNAVLIGMADLALSAGLPLTDPALRGRRPVRPGDRAQHDQQVDDEPADRDGGPDQVIGRAAHRGSSRPLSLGGGRCDERTV